MPRLLVITLTLAIAAICPGCGGDSKDPPPLAGSSGGTGGVSGQPSAGQSGGGMGGTSGGPYAGQSGGGSGGSAGDTGTQQQCPSGLSCAALAGGLVCVSSSTDLPPRCDGQGYCSVGECTTVDEERYCVEPCGPEPVAECPAGSACTAPAGAFLCSLDDTGAPPLCGEQSDCSMGECMPYQGESYCLQPCESSVVEQCPTDYKCLYVRGSFICARSSSGLPDTCGTTPDCSQGECVQSDGQGYCVQACEPTVVDQCPTDATCRTVVDAFMCALDSTDQPPACDTSGACTWGECVTVEGESHCLQYCSEPLIEVFGLVAGLDLAPLPGARICLFGNDQLPCATSDQDGVFALGGLPDEPYYLLTFSMTGYQPVLRLAYPFQVLGSSLLFTDEEAQATFTAGGGTYPESSTGSIAFNAATLDAQTDVVPVAGYSISLTPTPANGVGPVYADENLTPDPARQSSSVTGWGSYYNLTPGDYEMSFTHPTLDCGAPQPVKVIAGHLTSPVVAQCQ